MLTRHHDPRIIPLEVWDLLVDGVPLYDDSRNASFGRRLLCAARDLASGRATSESLASFPGACRDIPEVILTGGGARSVVLRTRSGSPCRSTWKGSLPPSVLASPFCLGSERPAS